MASIDLAAWISAMSDEGRVWYVKRLSANDTLATGAHQAGPYVPKDLLFQVLPELDAPTVLNPHVSFVVRIDSHGDERTVRAIWYNNRLHGGTRNEARITNWGGAGSALLDPENTGALSAFAFARHRDGPRLRVWVCRNPTEEDVIEDRFGPVEPGMLVVGTRAAGSAAAKDVLAPCRLDPADMPESWLHGFPAGIEIVRKSVELRPLSNRSADDRLILRRECEFEIFLSVEEALETPRIRAGFGSVTEFVAHAQGILQRRKARSGRSLELQMREVLVESDFKEGIDFAHQPESEAGKRPDFLFPSEEAYKDQNTDSSRLRMLATKTTCKDRWRQVINEADRIRTKHLLTLQEGVSVNQFLEMQQAGIQLVVPASLVSTYPSAVQPRLLTISSFLAEIRASISEAGGHAS